VARARNIKPSFFTSEQIADQCPMGRLLFIGLWTLADYKGDLEWKERTIKVQVLPFDECSIKSLAINLDKSGLIRFYSDGEKTFIHIPNFEKHQNPHKNEKEKGSDVPAFTDKQRQLIDSTTLTINRDKSGAKPSENGTHPADSLLLIPDSLSLNPDPGGPGSDEPDVADATPPPQVDKPAPKSKGSRIAVDWNLPDDWLAWAKKDFPLVDAVREAEKFADHWRAKAGADACKVDWLATWRNWIRKANEFKPAGKQQRHNDFQDRDYTAGVGHDGSF
jgi:hypothetical protein